MLTEHRAQQLFRFTANVTQRHRDEAMEQAHELVDLIIHVPNLAFPSPLTYTPGSPADAKVKNPPLTTCYVVDMSVNVSVRLDDRLAERLRLRSRAAGESLSDRLRRYAEEGARRDEHPMITFRDGPTGRRAGLVGGPDVWEIAMWIDELTSADPVVDLAGDGVVSRAQIDAALAYRSTYPAEIQARIDLHRSETAAVETR